jgi:hypothetical protein
MATIPAHSDNGITRHSRAHGEMSMRTLGAFLAITFGLAWGLLALLLLFTNQIVAIFGR